MEHHTTFKLSGEFTYFTAHGVNIGWHWHTGNKCIRSN